MGALEPQSEGVQGYFTAEDAHRKADLWSQLGVRQMSGSYLVIWWEKGSVVFQFVWTWNARGWHRQPPLGAAVGPKVQDGWGTLAKSPGVIPSIDVPDRVCLCLGWGWQEIAGRSSWCCGNLHILLFFVYLWSYTLPKARFWQFCNFWADDSMNVTSK